MRFLNRRSFLGMFTAAVSALTFWKVKPMATGVGVPYFFDPDKARERERIIDYIDDIMLRTGKGFVVYWYPPDQEAEVKQVGGRRNKLLIPREGKDVEVCWISPSDIGLKIIRDIIENPQDKHGIKCQICQIDDLGYSRDGATVRWA